MKKLSREEAAKVLESMKVKIEIPKAAVTQRERNAALDMAIEVLNCSEIPNNSDLISRREAIEAVEIFLKQTDAPEVYPGLIPALARVINNVPPAQPEIRTQMSSANCISRQAAIDLWEKYHHTIAVDAMQYDAELRQLPSAQPEDRFCSNCGADFREDDT